MNDKIKRLDDMCKDGCVHTKAMKICISCNEPLKGKRQIYCNEECYRIHQQRFTEETRKEAYARLKKGKTHSKHFIGLVALKK